MRFRPHRHLLSLGLLLLLVLAAGGCGDDRGQVARFDAVEEDLNAILKQTLPALQEGDSLALRARREELITLRVRAETLENGPATKVLREQLLLALDEVIDGVDAATRGRSGPHMQRCEECLERAAQALSRVHEERARLSTGR